MDFNKLKTYASNVKEEQRGLDRRVISKVAGVTFDGRQQLLSQLRLDSEVKLERDRRNEFDFYAVKVMVFHQDVWTQIGFLPRKMARLISQSLDAGQNLKAEIIRRTGGMTTDDGERLSFGLDIRITPEV